MFWARVDNRLVHGQVIEAWLPYTGAKTLLVCNSELSHDVLRQEIMSLAIPSNVRARFISAEKANEFIEYDSRTDRSSVLVLFADCQDARLAMENGLSIETLNIGNLHYEPGREQICPHVALSREDATCLRDLKERGVELDFRCLPTEPVQVKTTW
ncbi:PTS mannose/fructose/sorbose transporter subunit IIB [Oceanidesulfovibrio indonesiensis]|jgi:PTS system mannose-specific IIB component|uniref:PTS mannose/fructose/sorbose transporter subunit IIB n=1 Tax=Oceanidesulfovibrio indonesiensis TaxID=54767 RepID=A0A7M3MG79_9BACT|nr:PTS sugar transporter subunit IIB [Oceanidesulfovibrio indonesiensis]TVM18326.1 PTS mannose/fructose/sorbose transporter subunit IIB [Oceanidesulfovibrio indonesiensis]